MNLEARTGPVDVQATTALDYFDPVFPVWIFSSSGDIRFVLGFSFSFPGGSSLVILRRVSTSPPQGGARGPFCARKLGFVSSAFWYFFATAWGFAREVLTLPPCTPALSHFVIVSIFLHSSHFPFSLPRFPSLTCGSDSSRPWQSRHSMECSVPFFTSPVLRLRFSAVAFSLRLRSLAG